MSDDVIKEFAEKAKTAFLRAGGKSGESVYLGRYSIDYVPEAGVWVYEQSRDGKDLLIFASSYNNQHANFGEPAELDDAQEAFLRYLILEALADV